MSRNSGGAAQALSASRSFRNPLGARGVVIKGVTDTKLDLARATAYLLNPTCVAKRVEPRKWPQTGNQLRKIYVKFRGRSALRMAEFWSHVSLYDSVFGVGGGGKALRAEWSKQVRSQVRQASARELQRGWIAKDFDTAGFWQRLRNRNGPASFRPVQVATRSRNYRASRNR